MNLPTLGEAAFVQCPMTWKNGKTCLVHANRRYGKGIICHAHADQIDKEMWPDPRKPHDGASLQAFNDGCPFVPNVLSVPAMPPTTRPRIAPLPTTAPEVRWITRPHPMADKPMTYKEIVEYSGLSMNTVRKMVKQGILVPIDLCGIDRVLFDRRQVVAVFAARGRKAGPNK